MTIKEKQEIIEEIIKELKQPKTVYVEVCRDDVLLPSYAHVGDAGMDIRSAVDALILPGETKVIPTGLKMNIPLGYEIQVRPRSGLSLNTPLRIANTPGTIDSGYLDEIGIIVTNTSEIIDKQNAKYQTYSLADKNNCSGSYLIKKGDRIAQIVLCKYEEIIFEKTDNIKKIETNIDRGGGFGSSGTK